MLRGENFFKKIRQQVTIKPTWRRPYPEIFDLVNMSVAERPASTHGELLLTSLSKVITFRCDEYGWRHDTRDSQAS